MANMRSTASPASFEAAETHLDETQVDVPQCWDDSTDSDQAMAEALAPGFETATDHEQDPATTTADIPAPQVEDGPSSTLKLMKETFAKFFEDRDAALQVAAEKAEEEKPVRTPNLPVLYLSDAGLKKLKAACDIRAWRLKDDKSGTLYSLWSLEGVPEIDADHRNLVFCDVAPGNGKEKTLSFKIY